MTQENKIDHCSFCNNHKDIVKKLIVSDKVSICSDCIDLCTQLIKEDVIVDSNDSIDSNDSNVAHTQYDPSDIKAFLDKYVVGQEQAKIVLSVAIVNHYKRINKPPKDVEISKGNILFIGPTGSGKTLLAKTVSKYLNVPFVVADATSLTEAGYVGDDVESMISMLVSAANGDVKLAERGIVFIDEIDKIARKSESANLTRDVSGEGVQQALLKLVEGTTCRIPAGGGRKHPNGDMHEVNTKNILFIAGGAFVALKDILKNRLHGGTIGFSTPTTSNISTDLNSQITPEDLIKFGMIPEFIGRFTTTISLDELTREQLLKILTDTKNNYIDQYKYLFSIDGVALTFSDSALEQLVDNCIKLKTGARGLHTEIESSLMVHMYNLKNYVKNGINQLHMSRELILKPKALI